MDATACWGLCTPEQAAKFLAEDRETATYIRKVLLLQEKRERETNIHTMHVRYRKVRQRTINSGIADTASKTLA